jgi:hypothetical protein
MFAVACGDRNSGSSGSSIKIKSIARQARAMLDRMQEQATSVQKALHNEHCALNVEYTGLDTL